MVSSVVVTIGGGSVEATEDGIISVVPVTGAAMVEKNTQTREV
jgi:hypothetical protein